jgi:hypothetical protein
VLRAATQGRSCCVRRFPSQFVAHRLELEHPAVDGVPPHAAVPALGRPLAEPAVHLLPRQRRHGLAEAQIDGLDKIGAWLPLFLPRVARGIPCGSIISSTRQNGTIRSQSLSPDPMG